MIYKLLHKTLGWDYVYWRNTAAQGIARVYVSPDGTIYYYRYKITKVIDTIVNPKQVLWLTCKPNKYFKEDVKEP